jgi:hypothetical protein
MYTKLYKRLKLDVLNDLLDCNDSLSEKRSKQTQRLLDSAQTAFQKRTVSEYKRNITAFYNRRVVFDQFIAMNIVKRMRPVMIHIQNFFH